MFNIDIMRNKLDNIDLTMVQKVVMQSQNSVNKTEQDSITSNKINSREIGIKIDKAKEEIKEYLVKIMNSNQERQKDFEQMQNILNMEIIALNEKKDQLKIWQTKETVQKKAISNLDEPIQEMKMYIDQTINQLEKVRSVYRRANEKGWKIIFYHALARDVLKYEINNTQEHLRKKEEQYKKELNKIWVERANETSKLENFSNWINEVNRDIVAAKITMDNQKIKLGEFKEEITKWTVAYLYYSIIKTNLENLESKILFNLAINMENNTINLKEEQVIGLLEIWEQQKNDSDFIANRIKELGNYEKSSSYGEESDISFDDSNYFYKFLIRPQGVHIQSGYIIDGLEILYDLKMIELMHGGYGGSGEQIKLEPEDEIIKIQGVSHVPFIKSDGDAISYLTITTKKGKIYGPFGNPQNRGKSFEINIPEDKQFIGFYGSESQSGNGGFITKLGAVYRKKEKSL